MTQTARIALPDWADEMRATFRAGSVSQFILHGAIFDLVPFTGGDGSTRFLGLKQFIEEIMLARFDVVVRYDRGTGIRASRGLKELQRFLKSYDEWNGTSYARSPASIPRQPGVALGILDRFIDHCTQFSVIEGGQVVRRPIKVAVLMDYVHFIAPRGDSLQISGPHGEAVIRLVDWASDPALVESHAMTVLFTENLADIHPAISTNPYASKLEIKLPTQAELKTFIELMLDEEPSLKECLDFTPEVLASRVVGLSRVNLRNAIHYASRNDQRIDDAYVTRKRRELIEKECRGLLDFIESTRSLDDVAGHTEARAWLRDDATLLRTGNLRSVPMGYLMCGRIGTGKTYLTTCWAGEIGIPCVVLKNFRDKWQGSTEGNLEKIFAILKALGQVLVFVDEADQATGKRDGGAGDSGVSGRVYAMLAKEMSDTNNRGRIVWVFATSRPDLVEVDLKRPGRLDVHIPLFPPQTDAETMALFRAMAKKTGLDPKSLPKLPASKNLGGNEMEALLVRARRTYDLQTGKKKRSLKTILKEVIADFRPMAHTAKLEFMDLIAVKECTDTRFLPEAYKDLTIDEVDQRIEALKLVLGER